MNNLIVLQNTEIEIAKLLAKYRGKKNREAGIINPVFDHTLSEDEQFNLDLNSVGAELAFCKFRNIWPDLTTHVRAKGPDCIDGSAKIDVKHTIRSTGRLLIRCNKNLEDADEYVLVTGQMPDYRIVGWIPAEYALQTGYIDRELNPPCYAIAQDKLIQFNDLLTQDPEGARYGQK